MRSVPRIDRARRNALKAGGLLLSALAGAGAASTGAWAQNRGNGNGNGNGNTNGNGNGNGNNGNGNGNGGSGGSCFARGTRILTRDGYRPIETLAAGDEVAVKFAGFAPIKTMVGHTLTSAVGQWDGNPNNLPVRIRRGALGENMPAADLRLTALHSVYIDGVLIHVSALINGTTILFEEAEGQGTLDFFNIELDRHDILDAQGAACESMARVGTERCVPVVGFDGRRSVLRSRMRSVVSLVIDRRQPIDVVRDKLEERALDFARAA